MKIRVILADDHVMLREGIKQLLEFDQTIQVVAEANDGIECLEKLETVPADVLLLDINMPNKNGLDTLQEIKRKKKKIKILILNSINKDLKKKAQFEEITFKTRISIALMKKEHIKTAFCFLYFIGLIKRVLKKG